MICYDQTFNQGAAMRIDFNDPGKPTPKKQPTQKKKKK